MNRGKRSFYTLKGETHNMNHTNRLYLSFILLIGIVTLWGCPKKTDVAATQSPSEKTASTTPASGIEGTPAASKSAESNEKAGTMAESLKPIYFDFDKSFIRSDAKSVMKANAEWLKANPKVKVRIEGNCDDRGTKEYNQALGQRRATSAKKYLTDMGVSRHRISLISYGKEKPLCSEQSEACWQKNRRDDFVVTGE
jgi:peptidoglycan-associated lipoprotein